MSKSNSRLLAMLENVLGTATGTALGHVIGTWLVKHPQKPPKATPPWMIAMRQELIENLPAWGFNEVLDALNDRPNALATGWALCCLCSPAGVAHLPRDRGERRLALLRLDEALSSAERQASMRSLAVLARSCLPSGVAKELAQVHSELLNHLDGWEALVGVFEQDVDALKAVMTDPKKRTEWQSAFERHRRGELTDAQLKDLAKRLLSNRPIGFA